MKKTRRKKRNVFGKEKGKYVKQKRKECGKRGKSMLRGETKEYKEVKQTEGK